MNFNKGREYQRFEQQWEKEKESMLKAGMSEEDIRQIYEFDRMCFNSRRRYEEHKLPNISLQSLSIEENFEKDLDFIELISDENLYAAISKLKPTEQELLRLLIIKELKITEIALLKSKSKSSISEKMTRIKIKIKKFYDNPNKA